MLLDRIQHRAAALGARKAAEPAPAAPGRLRADTSWDPPSETKQERAIALYTKLAWVQIAIKIASQTAAATPYRVRAKAGDDRREIADHPLLDLLARPNPLQSRFEFLEATFSWRAGAGNCYWWLNRPNAETPPAEMWIVPANRIRPVPDGKMSVRGYLYDDGGGEPIPLDAWEVVHFKTWNPLDKYVGLSPIEALMLDAMGDLGAQKYNANFYGKDNAKSAGILAFADYIEQGAWDQLAADWKEQHGGTSQNRIMRLRGVGKGGVEWIPTQLTRVETQYLEQRTFTKEEIFDMFAPGLSSVLSVNATEANSTAGKDTFLSMCVYPQHVAVSEKIDRDLLPAYGDDLDGEFDDVRRTDTQIELLEQEAYERTHTIDEVRAKYYQDKPLPPGARTVAQGPEPPKPAPVPPQLQGEPPVDLAAAGKALDRRRWRDKAAKALVAGRGPDVAFDPEYLTDDEAMQIRAALRRARTAEDVAGVFQ